MTHIDIVTKAGIQGAINRPVGPLNIWTGNLTILIVEFNRRHLLIGRCIEQNKIVVWFYLAVVSGVPTSKGNLTSLTISVYTIKVCEISGGPGNEPAGWEPVVDIAPFTTKGITVTTNYLQVMAQVNSTEVELNVKTRLACTQ